MIRGGRRESRLKRSRTGCIECRQRKIKCDESHPTCRQCAKSGKPCSIRDSIFKPHALSSETNGGQDENIRHAPTVGQFARSQHQADSETDGGQDESVGQAPTASPLARSQNQVNLDIPAGNDEEDSPPPVQDIQTDQASIVVPEGRLHDSETDDGVGAIDAALRAPPDYMMSGIVQSSSLDETEETFFLRYFSENIAPWLDLVNFQRYFGHECIALVRENSLLRFATCALAAKQLGQSSRSTMTAFHNTSKAQAAIASVLLQSNPSFLWYGAKYYDKAITTLARQIAPRETQMYPSPSETGSEVSFPHLMARADGEDPIVRLLATCLLIQFENLSGKSRGWTGHLNGFSRLLTLLNDGSLFNTNPLTQRTFDARSQRGLRAAFWWFAINDMEESLINHRRMRIDIDNTSLWQHMGLHMYEDGQPFDLDTCATPDAPPHLQEDLWSFVLIRIVCRLVNILASDDMSNNQGVTSQSHDDDDINALRAIQFELDNWISAVPATFRPNSTWRPFTPTAETRDDLFDTEVWYSHSFRAVTILYYHMAYMLLIIHQPPQMAQPKNRRLPFDLLKAMGELRLKLRFHARQVMAVTAGMIENSAVRVRAVQPLYVAGRSLTEQDDRRRIVRIIRSIQDDLGMMCEYRVVDLIEEWSVSYENLGLSPRLSGSSHD